MTDTPASRVEEARQKVLDRMGLGTSDLSRIVDEDITDAFAAAVQRETIQRVRERIERPLHLAIGDMVGFDRWCDAALDAEERGVASVLAALTEMEDGK